MSGPLQRVRSIKELGAALEQTHENIVAMRLRALAREMNSTAHEMRLLGTKPAKQHAKEMDGAAKIAREWAREIKASNVEAQGRLTAASSPAGVPLERRVGPQEGKENGAM